MSRHGYEDPRFLQGAAQYYDVDAAISFLDSPVAEGCSRWRCVLCGWPIDLNEQQALIAGACCCGGCGMTCLRPIAEFKRPI